MPLMHRVKVKWSGFSGAPGWSNFYFREFSNAEGSIPAQADSDMAALRVRAFMANVAPVLPPSVTVQVQNDVEIIEATTGRLETVHTVPASAVVTGTNATTTYSGPTGMVVTWRTNAVRNGRRLRGRTFIVPCATSIYEANGTIAAAHLETVQNAANTLLSEPASPDLGIWGRPSAVGAADGVWADASGATVPDLAAILRSRRD